MNLISWNYRGLRHPLKVNATIDLVRTEYPNILLIQETKSSEQEMNQIIQKIKHYEGTTINAIGASGGICIMWNQASWEPICLIKEQHWIKTELKNKTSKIQISIFNLYAPSHFGDKDQCRQSLVDWLDS